MSDEDEDRKRSLCSLPETIGDDDDGPIILSKIVLTLLYK